LLFIQENIQKSKGIYIKIICITFCCCWSFGSFSKCWLSLITWQIAQTNDSNV